MLLLGICLVPVSANSAQSWFEGVDSAGAIMTDKESPIVVEHERLTFDIGEFPQNYYIEKDDYLAYNAKVTAEYTFYNPSEYTVTAKLLFPFGKVPSYVHGFYDEDGNYMPFVDTDKYDITINGEVIDKRIRYTLSESWAPFDLQKDLSLISDDYIKDDFYSPELTVTKYTLYISGVDTSTYKSADVAIDVPQRLGGYRIYIPEANGCHLQDNGDARLHTGVPIGGKKFEMYIFGTPPADLPTWTAYKDGGVEDGEEIAGQVALIDTETIAFKDFALAERDESSEISEIDWYNATVAEIKSSAERSPTHPIVYSHSVGNSFNNNLMRWYEYEITLAPHERIVNAVTAPMYPAIDLDYEPDIYEYTYLLSPAKTWKEFGELEIIINTPYYITESGEFDFEKTEDGYTLTLDGLPEGELTFTMSTAQNPEKEASPYAEMIVLGILGIGVAALIVNIVIYLILGIILFFFMAILGIIALIIYLLVKSKKKKNNGNK